MLDIPISTDLPGVDQLPCHDRRNDDWDFGSGLAEDGEIYFDDCASLANHRQELPKIIPSIAARIGLDQFIYMQGLSGKRYVFSSINLAQIELYGEAIVVASKSGSSSPIWTGMSSAVPQKIVSDCISNGDVEFHVHLLAQSDVERRAVLMDLGGTFVSAQSGNDNDFASNSSLRSRIPMDRNCSTVWKI